MFSQSLMIHTLIVTGSGDQDTDIFDDLYSIYHRTGRAKGETLVSDLGNLEVKIVKMSPTQIDKKKNQVQKDIINNVMGQKPKNYERGINW